MLAWVRMVTGVARETAGNGAVPDFVGDVRAIHGAG